MYLSVAQLRDAIGPTELSNGATPANRRALSADKLNQAINGTLPSADPDYADALAAIATITEVLTVRSSYVDGFLAAYTPLPIADPYVPVMIQQIMIALARFDLAKDIPSATVIQRYKDARADLQSIADGTLVLAFPPGSTTSLSGSTPAYCADDPIYTRASTKRFQNPYGIFP